MVFPNRHRSGFSLIECLIVLAIIGILFGMLMGGVQAVRERAARLQCQNNLRQIALACHAYEDTRGHLPLPAATIGTKQAFVSWFAHILPLMDQSNRWQQAVMAADEEGLSYLSPPHPGNTIVPSYVCPSDPLAQIHSLPLQNLSVSYGSYCGVAGGYQHNGVFAGHLRLVMIRDGTSNTVMVGERPPPASLLAGWWYAATYNTNWPDWKLRGPDTVLLTNVPAGDSSCWGPFHFGPGRVDNSCDRFHFWSHHPGGANFVFADGSCRFLAYTDSNVLPAMASVAGGD